MRVAMFVTNPVTHDARVRREAATLAAAGHEVVVVGTLPDGGRGATAAEWIDGYRVIRIGAPRSANRRRRLLREAPWRLRRDIGRAIVRGVRQGPRGMLRAALIAVLAIPWAAWAAISYALRGRRTSEVAPRPADWVAYWRVGVAEWAARAAEAAGRADAYHGHDLSGAIAAREARRVHNPSARLVYDSHEVILEAGRNAAQPASAKAEVAAIERAIVHEADAQVVVNEAVAKELASRYGAPTPTVVVYNCPPVGAPTARRSPLRAALGLEPGVPLAMYHGNLGAVRGLRELVDAMRDPRLAGVHLAFMGSGRMEAELRDAAGSAEFGGRLHVLPPVLPDDIVTWVAGADVSLMPNQPATLNELVSTPNKLFESLSAGVPVVTSDFPERRRIVLEDPAGPLGAVCDPTDPADIARAMAELLVVPEDARREQRRRCLEAARERWNWEREGGKLVALYASFAGGVLAPANAPAPGEAALGPRPPGPVRVLTVARWYPSHDLPGRGSFVADLVRATPFADHRVVSFDRLLARGAPTLRPTVASLARALFDRHIDPAALFTRLRLPGGPEAPVARLPLIRIPGQTGYGSVVDDHTAALRPFVVALTATWRPDVIHAHTGLPDGVAAVTVGRELGIPVVITEHMSTLGAVLADPEGLRRYAQLATPGVTLCAVSPHLAQLAAAGLGLPEAAIEVAPNPVPDALFTPADPGARDPDELLWVGKLDESKGTDVLLRAFAHLRGSRPTVRLRMIGSPTDASTGARFAALARDLGIAPFVSFDGWQPREVVAEAMATAVVLVHPSPFETFGVVAAEAILRGLPVAARRSGGVPWVIELSGGFGEVAEGDDDEAFAAAIGRVLDGRARFAAFRSQARARLLARVSTEAVGDAWRERYARATELDLVAASGGPREDDVSLATEARGNVPRVAVGSGRDEALRLVAGLPLDLRDALTLVTAAPVGVPHAAVTVVESSRVCARIVEIAPRLLGTTTSTGGGLALGVRRRAARLVGMHARVAAAEAAEWHAAIRDAVEAHGGGASAAIAIDAHGALMIEGAGVGLAPGALRWLADRWAADRAGEPSADVWQAPPAQAPEPAAVAQGSP